MFLDFNEKLNGSNMEWRLRVVMHADHPYHFELYQLSEESYKLGLRQLN